LPAFFMGLEPQAGGGAVVGCPTGPPGFSKHPPRPNPKPWKFAALVGPVAPEPCSGRPFSTPARWSPPGGPDRPPLIPSPPPAPPPWPSPPARGVGRVAPRPFAPCFCPKLSRLGPPRNFPEFPLGSMVPKNFPPPSAAQNSPLGPLAPFVLFPWMEVVRLLQIFGPPASEIRPPRPDLRGIWRGPPGPLRNRPRGFFSARHLSLGPPCTVWGWQHEIRRFSPKSSPPPPPHAPPLRLKAGRKKTPFSPHPQDVKTTFRFRRDEKPCYPMPGGGFPPPRAWCYRKATKAPFVGVLEPQTCPGQGKPSSRLGVPGGRARGIRPD